MMFKKIKKYQILFVVKRYDIYVLKNIVKLNKIQEIIQIKGKQYTINMKFPTYISETGITTYIIDFDTSNQLNFTVIKAPLNKEDMDLFFGQKIIKEITKGVMQDKKEKMLNILLGVILGALTSFLIAMVIFQHKIDEIYKTMLNSSTIPIINL